MIADTLCQGESHKYDFTSCEKLEDRKCWDNNSKKTVCIRCKFCSKGVRVELLREHNLLHELEREKDRAEDLKMFHWAKAAQDKWGKDFDYQLAVLCGEEVPTDQEQRFLNYAAYGDEYYPNWRNNL